LLSVSPFYLILSADFLMGKAMLIPTRSLWEIYIVISCAYPLISLFCLLFYVRN
jgi:hypothetical protein